MTERELKRLPSFLTEDGERRYICERFRDFRLLDEYGRTFRRETDDGISRYGYDDENHTVTIIGMFITGEFYKKIYEMSEGDYPENRLKMLRGGEASYDGEYGDKELLMDETEKIQSEVDELLNKYPGLYLAFDTILYEIGEVPYDGEGA